MYRIFIFIYYFEKDIEASNNIVTLGEVALHHPGLGDVAFLKKNKEKGKRKLLSVCLRERVCVLVSEREERLHRKAALPQVFLPPLMKGRKSNR
jgi:hypothetical protein